MFIYKNGKLYIQNGDKIVGVNVDALGSTIVKGTEIKMDYDGPYSTLDMREVHLKFQTAIGGSYKFPVPETKPRAKAKTTKK